jgi:hypothetical protein
VKPGIVRIIFVAVALTLVAVPMAAAQAVTGLVTQLRIDTAGSDNAARIKVANQAGCGGFFNISSADSTFPQMVAVLQTALITSKPVSLTVGANCRITSVTISAN